MSSDLQLANAVTANISCTSYDENVHGSYVVEMLWHRQSKLRSNFTAAKFDLGSLLLDLMSVVERFPDALFLDRDGTLIEWVHYLCDPSKVKLIPGVGEALNWAKSRGCLLFLHTNQSGVGRGYFSRRSVRAVNEAMFALLGVDESFFDEVCIATEVPDEASLDSYRKPSPRFANEMVAKYDLDPRCCLYVGDSESDVRAGLNAGMSSLWVLGKIQGRDMSQRQGSEHVMLHDTLSQFVSEWRKRL